MRQKYLSWNVVEFPAMACIYIDYDDTATGERWNRLHRASAHTRKRSTGDFVTELILW
jgi:hypothetical protein